MKQPLWLATPEVVYAPSHRWVGSDVQMTAANLGGRWHHLAEPTCDLFFVQAGATLIECVLVKIFGLLTLQDSNPHLTPQSHQPNQSNKQSTTMPSTKSLLVRVMLSTLALGMPTSSPDKITSPTLTTTVIDGKECTYDCTKCWNECTLKAQCFGSEDFCTMECGKIQSPVYDDSEDMVLTEYCYRSELLLR